MDIYSFIYGVCASLVAAFIWAFGVKRRKNYNKQKIKDLEFEKNKIIEISDKPSELYRDSLRGIYFLFLLVGAANVIRIFHQLIYQDSFLWQQAFTEGGVWFMLVIITLRFISRIEASYDKQKAVNDIDTKIDKIKSS